MNATRERTNSVTHLIQIIVREEIDKRMKVIEGEKNITLNRLNALVDDMREGIISSLEKAGRPWSVEEDSLLRDEIKTALAQIAKNHSRSVGAIKARITKDQLTYG